VEERKIWQENQHKIDTPNTYWIDETGTNTGMTRLYGRAFSNERIFDYVPDVRFERTSLIGALGVNGITAPLTYSGTLNGLLFHTYLKERLAPALKKGDTVIMDNCSAHIAKGVIQPLLEKGVNVVFLPPYSPDFNPVELAWSKIKAYLRKVKARTADELFTAIGEALNLITHDDIIGWIEHCGYGL
jgi:transposase